MKLVRYREHLAAHGDFQQLTDVDCAIDGILKALGIRRGTYIADPETGCNVIEYVFKASDEITRMYLEEEVRSAVSQVPNTTLEGMSLQVSPDKKTAIIRLDVSVHGVKKTVSFLVSEEYISLLDTE